MVIVLHLWILRDCHQKMVNGTCIIMQVCVISSSQHTLSLEGLSRRGLQQQTIRYMYLVGTCMCFHSTSVIGVHGITLPPESDPLLQSTLMC